MRLQILSTNGKKIIRLVWFENLNGKGLYSSVFIIGINHHFSYHLDGNVHSKIDPSFKNRVTDGQHLYDEKGYAPLGKGPPLNNFIGLHTFISGTIDLDDKCFAFYLPYKLKKADKIILLDNRQVNSGQKSLHYYFDLIEPNNYKIIEERIRQMQKFLCRDNTFICEHHCYFEQTPWLIVHIGYKSVKLY